MCAVRWSSLLDTYASRHRMFVSAARAPWVQVAQLYPNPGAMLATQLHLETGPGATADGRSYTIQPRSHAGENRTAPSHHCGGGARVPSPSPAACPPAATVTAHYPKSKSAEARQTMRPAPRPHPWLLHVYPRFEQSPREPPIHPAFPLRFSFRLPERTTVPRQRP